MVEGKTFLVTGACGGIGRAICRLLTERGAVVIDSDIDEAASLTLDVTDEVSWQAAEILVREKHGLLHGLVNNAGVILMQPLLETSLEDFQRVNRINN